MMPYSVPKTQLPEPEAAFAEIPKLDVPKDEPCKSEPRKKPELSIFTEGIRDKSKFAAALDYGGAYDHAGNVANAPSGANHTVAVSSDGSTLGNESGSGVSMVLPFVHTPNSAIPSEVFVMMANINDRVGSLEKAVADIKEKNDRFGDLEKAVTDMKKLLETLIQVQAKARSPASAQIGVQVGTQADGSAYARRIAQTGTPVVGTGSVRRSGATGTPAVDTGSTKVSSNRHSVGGLKASESVSRSGLAAMPRPARLPQRPSVPPTPTAMRRSPGLPQRPSVPPTPTVRSRHRRTETPETMAVARAIAATGPGGMQIKPQEDRALLNDFFNEIKNWAALWVIQSVGLTPALEEQLAELPMLAEFFAQTEDFMDLVRDLNTRVSVLAGIVCSEIALHTLSDRALANSCHPNAADTVALYNKFGDIRDNGYGANYQRHALLLEQRDLFLHLYEDDQRAWRSEMTQNIAANLILSLHPFLDEKATHGPVAQSMLQDLLIKGYRIGFRMRMEPTKWSMRWIVDGEGYDINKHVTDTRFMHGAPFEAMTHIYNNPGLYRVRVGITPIIVKRAYGSGQEEAEVIHKAECIVGPKF